MCGKALKLLLVSVARIGLISPRAAKESFLCGQ